jgi:hypothetical protein
MDANVDTTVGGVTELRIHGVSGTPPGRVLDYPHPERVKGDGEAGFYRRAWLGTPLRGIFGDEAGRRRREAYEWGGLTSGSGLRAFWLLLLPFMLVNLGFFMMPRPDGRAKALRRTAYLIQRWFALSLTGTLILTAMELAGDLVAWQCTAPGGACRTATGTDPGWLWMFATTWTSPTERRVALASLVPGAVVVLLWALGRWTWAKHERTPIPARSPASGPPPRLAERGLWNGAEPVGRLRSLHVAAGFGVIALVVALPFTEGVAARVMVVLTGAVLIAAASLVAWHPVAARGGPDGADGGLNRWCAGVRWAAIAVYVIVLVLAAFDGLGPEPARRPSLPGFAAVVGGLYYVQLGLLVVLLIVTAVLAWLARSADRDALYPRALPGIGPPAALLAGWLVAGGLAGGGATQFARLLDAPVAPSGSSPGEGLVLPGPFEWMALGAVALTAGLVLTIAALVLRWWSRLGFFDARLGKLYPDDGVRRSTAAYTAAAGLTDSSRLVFGGLAGYAAVLIVVGTIAYRLDLDWPGRVQGLTTLGSWIIGGFVLGLLILGRDLYRRPALRRTVGILWDVGTFWPRAVHPFAPPCYTERVIPDLIKRIEALAPGENDKVIVSAHSQGSVIAATLVLQLDEPARRRVGLLTYGSPAARLYGRFFPAYFGSDALRAVEQAVTSGHGTGWCNLYRLTDPIGGPVRVLVKDDELIARGDVPIDHRDIDHHLWDPPRGETGDDPPVFYSHWDYFTGPGYRECLTHLERG